MLALIALLIMQKPPLTARERVFLAHIRQAVAHMTDKRASFVRFEQAVPESDAAFCGKLLLKVAPNSADYASCAFAQAYYGLDYDANLQRLLRPYRLWHSHIHKWEQEYPNSTMGTPTDLDGVYSSLNWLYLKHHDLKSLGAWIDLRLDGAWAEGSDGELSDLWKRHKADMLKAASASTRRLENLHDALIFGDDGADERTIRRNLIADLKPYLHNKDNHNKDNHNKDNRISQAAHELNRLVYRDKSK
jgi:hypothetical protein